MTKQLIPGAFRVFDTVGNRYVETEGFVLNRFGGLMALKNHPEYPAMVYICSDVADPDRYQVERWTGLYDCDGKPVYEGDIVSYGGGPASNPENVLTVKYHQENRFTGFGLQDYWGWNMGMMSILTHRPTIGTVHDSPETLAAAAKAVNE